jgi:hypothetical protein
VRLAICVPPFKLAVMMAVSSVDTLLTVAVNCALVWPLDTVTLAGTVTFPLLSESPTEVFDVAAADRETVHVEDPAPVKPPGEQLKPLSAAGANRVIWSDWLEPFSVPVTVAMAPAVIVPAVTVNCALVCPFDTVTLPGVVS